MFSTSLSHYGSARYADVSVFSKLFLKSVTKPSMYQSTHIVRWKISHINRGRYMKCAIPTCPLLSAIDRNEVWYLNRLFNSRCACSKWTSSVLLTIGWRTLLSFWNISLSLSLSLSHKHTHTQVIWSYVWKLHILLQTSVCYRLGRLM